MIEIVSKKLTTISSYSLYLQETKKKNNHCLIKTKTNSKASNSTSLFFAFIILHLVRFTSSHNYSKSQWNLLKLCTKNT